MGECSFLVPAHPGSPGQRAIKQLSVCAHDYNYHNLRKSNQVTITSVTVAAQTINMVTQWITALLQVSDLSGVLLSKCNRYWYCKEKTTQQSAASSRCLYLMCIQLKKPKTLPFLKMTLRCNKQALLPLLLGRSCTNFNGLTTPVHGTVCQQMAGDSSRMQVIK